MIRPILLIGLGVLLLAQPALAVERSRSAYDSMIARHAAANGVPESLVRRVIARESRGNARAVSRGNYGLMQIRLATARSMGYRGSPAGLLDADTNMTYAVRYLAGAYRAAGGNAARAESYYRTGYYHSARRQRTVAPAAGWYQPQQTTSRRSYRARKVASASTGWYRTETAAQRRSYRSRPYRARASAGNPVARFFSNLSRPSHKARRAKARTAWWS